MESKLGPKSDLGLIGATGEFFVAAELSRRGVVATLTIKNTPLIDVIATNLITGQTCNIQVKTKSERNSQGWKLSDKVEKLSEIKNHFFVFVELGNHGVLPNYYIIPNNVFAEYQQRKQQTWLAKTDRQGKPHKDNKIRNFKPATEDKEFGQQYFNNWDLLKID